jgi:hypothetical protein
VPPAVVAKATPAHERGRAAPVKVDRLKRAQSDHRRRELIKREPSLVIRTTVASESDQMLAIATKRRARMPAHSDIRVELLSRGRESFLIAADGSSIGNQERTGL